MSVPPSTICTSRPSVFVEALVDGGEVAAELRLHEPLQLQLDLGACGCRAFRHVDGQPGAARPGRGAIGVAVVAAGPVVAGRTSRCRRRADVALLDLESLPQAATTSGTTLNMANALSIRFVCMFSPLS